ncbi:MAG: hypothetical protein ACYC9L_14125 [Sulfuricaulis sp.]
MHSITGRGSNGNGVSRNASGVFERYQMKTKAIVQKTPVRRLRSCRRFLLTIAFQLTIVFQQVMGVAS